MESDGFEGDEGCAAAVAGAATGFASAFGSAFGVEAGAGFGSAAPGFASPFLDAPGPPCGLCRRPLGRSARRAAIRCLIKLFTSSLVTDCASDLANRFQKKLASSSLVNLPSLFVSAAANSESSRASARRLASRASPALPAR